jgi:hypothetical protein
METSSGKARVVEGMSFEEYAAAPGINASLLCAVDELSLEEAKAQMDGRSEFYSDALDFGEALHALWLEGRRAFEVQPLTYLADDGADKPWNNNAKVCRSWCESVEAKGKVILTEKEEETLRGMVTKLVDHPKLQGIRGRSELSVFVEKDGIPLKIRVDTLPDDRTKPVIDLKSCRRANPEKFVRDALDRRYHLKAAFYLDVLHIAAEDLNLPELHRNCFSFISQRKDAPYSIGIMDMADTPESFLRIGRFLYRDAYRKIKEAMKSGEWPDYGHYQAESFAPPWTIKQLEETRIQLAPDWKKNPELKAA